MDHHVYIEYDDLVDNYIKIYGVDCWHDLSLEDDDYVIDQLFAAYGFISQKNRKKRARSQRN